MKEDLEREVPRRDFLKLLGIGTAAISGGVIWEETKKVQERKAASFVHELETHRIVYPQNDIPENLRGFYVNMVYTYLADPTTWKTYIDEAKTLHTNRARLFVGDEFEPVLGLYNFTVIDKAASFIKQLKQEGMGVEIDIFDCFTLGNGALHNGVSSPSFRFSPYNTSRNQAGYREFFTDPILISIYKRRLKTLIRSLHERDISDVSSWSVANEPDPRLIGTEGKTILTDWYKQVTPVIRKEVGYSSILSGVARPSDIFYNSILGLTGNTSHVYTDQDLQDLSLHLSQTNDPVVIQEFGVTNRIFGISKKILGLYDYLDLRFTADMLAVTMKKKENFNIREREILARVSSFGGWKIASHDDDFSFMDQDMSAEKRKLLLSLEKLRK